MDFNTTIDIIIKDLKEIGEIVDDFKNYPDVPGLQIELVKSKCRYAEEIISLLKKYRPEETKELVPEEVSQKIPPSDLSRAIRLNERFLFIREIFDGNSSAYEEAIFKLNKAENLSDAKAIIMSYTGEAEETEVVSQLLEIVKRKLPLNG